MQSGHFAYQSEKKHTAHGPVLWGPECQLRKPHNDIRGQMMTTKYSRETVPMMGVKHREASAKSQVQNENVILQNGEYEVPGEG